MTALPTLKQLRHLVLLADHGHFGRAARAGHLTQSSLSASIKELETLLQANLVERTKRRVALTPLGIETVARARRVLRETEELALAAQAGREPLTGTIRLGVIPTIGPYLLPPVLPALRRAWPKLKLYLREDQTERLLEQLRASTLDVLLVALPYDCGPVETEILFDDGFVAALPHDHHLGADPPVAPESLEGETLLLLQDGHCLRDHALSACGLPPLRHPDEFEATSLTTLVQMVDNGLGLTLLPQLALDAGILRGTRLQAQPVAGSPARQVGLVWRYGTVRGEEFRLLGREIRRLGERRRGGTASGETSPRER
jgi:LysR family hydrogen peroxide-inducible transcriptional activator